MYSANLSARKKVSGNGGAGSPLSRRAMLAGSIGAAAFVAMPDIASASTSVTQVAGSGGAASAAPGHFFLYGITGPGSDLGAGVQAVKSPGSRTAARSAPVSVITGLAATPVISPDLAWLALVMVEMAAAGATVTVSIVEKASALIAQRITLVLPGIPADASVLVTPVFSPDASAVSLVMAISTPGNIRLIRKADPLTGGSRTVRTAVWRSRHALAYFDRRTGTLAGPFYLDNEPSLALSTAVATTSDLFIWTTKDPQAVTHAKNHPVAPPLPWISAFPFGSGKARFTVPSSAPWPGGEPASALANGDAARFVNARTLQICSARDGHLEEVTVAPLNASRAKPSPVTMTARPDGTLFLAKPSIGRAVIIDPARSFTVKSDITFPASAKPFGGLPSKAVLSPSGDRLYVLGDAKVGGLSCYDVATGALIASYSHGSHYSGVYQLSSGSLLAVSVENPRLTYFSPTLSPLGTTDTSLLISDVY
jgi:hypothetical protein